MQMESKKELLSGKNRRRLQSYPRPKLFNQVEEFKAQNDMTTSEAVNYILNVFFNNHIATNQVQASKQAC